MVKGSDLHSGNLTFCYSKWHMNIVDLPTKNSDFPHYMFVFLISETKRELYNYIYTHIDLPSFAMSFNVFKREWLHFGDCTFKDRRLYRLSVDIKKLKQLCWKLTRFFKKIKEHSVDFDNLFVSFWQVSIIVYTFLKALQRRFWIVLRNACESIVATKK
jgi:hypothetical protein